MSYVESTWKRISDKLFPNLAKKALANNYKLVEFDLRGALSTTILGVEGQGRKWTDADKLTGDIIGELNDSNRVWMSKMFELQSLNIRPISGGRHLATTSINENFFSNTNRVIEDINLQGMDVQTANDEAGLLVEIYKGSSHRKVNLVGYEAEYLTANTDLARSAMSTIVGTMGYTAALDEEVVFITGAEHSRSADKLTYSQVTSYWNAVNGSTIVGLELSAMQFYRNMIVDAMSATPPGIKYVPVICMAGVLDMKSIGTLPEFQASADDSKAYSFGALVPVIDDGAGYSQALFITGKGEWLHRIPDSRYGTTSTRAVRINSLPTRMAEIFPGRKFSTLMGRQLAVNEIPSNLALNTAQLGDNILLLLAPPVEKQHYVLSSAEIAVEDIVIDGVSGKYVKVKAVVELFATKVTKAWYEEYYQTGFGLYQPRNSNIRANVLKQWNDLKFEELGVCCDAVYSTISPNIVYDTDLARRYRKAREQACKDNDWLQRPFMTGVTYGDVRQAIVNSPKLSAFYSVSSISVMDDIIPEEYLTHITWAVDTAGTKFTRTDKSVNPAAVETLPVNSTSLELCAIECARGAVSTIPDAFWEQQYPSDRVAESIREVQGQLKNPYLKQRQALKGYVMKEQYFTPSEALAQSGYPVYRFMHPTYANAMVMRMYADLKPIGDKILQCLQSFTGNVIKEKLLAGK